MSKVEIPEVEPYDEREYVWEQKWRCVSLDEIALPARIRDMLVGYTKLKRIPSIVLNSRSPGTGKTTTARALAREVGCKKPLYVNASLKTDIANIRTEVHRYSTGASVGGNQKVVILDEGERLSPAAQESLKGLMEQVSKNCIFIITTNNKNNLVDPLLSRSRVIDYEWNEQESRDMVRQIIVRMISILNYEGIEFDKRVLAKLVQRKFPDNRRLMGTLQDYAQTNGKIDEGVLSYNQSSNFRELVEIMKGQNFNELKQWVYDNQDRVSESFLGELARYLIEPKRVNDDKHAAIIEGSSIPDVIEFLGEEQKAFHQAGDKWLFLIRILMVLGGPSGVKWNSEFNYVE